MDRRSLLQHGLACLLIGVLGFNLRGLSRQLELTFDEPAWITSGYITFELYRRAEPASAWAIAYDAMNLGDWGNRNPPVGKWIFGAAASRVLTSSDRVIYRWIWGESPFAMSAQGLFPPAHVLHGVRDATVACAVLALVCVYIVAIQLLRVPWIPLLAPLGLYAIPAFRLHAAVVYTDIPQLMFLLAAAASFLAFVQRHRIVWLAAASIAAGLAVATKLSAAPLVIATIVSLLVARQALYKRLAWAGVVCVLAPTAFVAVNPYLCPAPIERSVGLVTEWKQQKVAQQKFARTDSSRIRDEVVSSRLNAAGLVVMRAVLSQEQIPHFDQRQPGFVGTVDAWSWGLIVALIGARSKRVWKASPERAKALALGLSMACIVYLAVYTRFGGAITFLVGLGVGALVRAGAGGDERSAFVAIAFATNAVCIALWLPFDWARYYLPVLIWMPLVALSGLCALVRCTEATDGSTARVP